MTKKDYIMIAQAIRLEYALQDASGQLLVRDVAKSIAQALWADNTRFDFDLFMKASVDERNV